jgi:hypothetical protein
MTMREELALGIEKLRESVKRGGKLKIIRSDHLGDRMAHRFVVASGKKQVDFVLSDEFLEDLPATIEYQTFLKDYVSLLEKRFEQPNPLDFYCKSGNAINIEVHWPITPIADRDDSFVHVDVTDIRVPTLIAKCSVVFVYPVESAESEP